jgi:hypothetical protein
MAIMNLSNYELCNRCNKKKDFEDKGGDIRSSSRLTEDEDERHEMFYEKMKFLLIDCRLESLQKEASLPNSFPLKI